MEMEEAETIDVYELDYSDLCSPSSSTIVDFIMEALGPGEPGLLSITSVPNASNLCSHLLPLARNLALLDRETRKLVLKMLSSLNNLRGAGQLARDVLITSNCCKGQSRIQLPVMLIRVEFTPICGSSGIMIMIYDPNKKRAIMVRAPPEGFIIQVGESADIISKGKLRSTLHSVHRLSKFEKLSRETFVVFL